MLFSASQARELLDTVDQASSDKDPEASETETEKAKTEEGEADTEKKEEGEEEDKEKEKKKKEDEEEEKKKKLKELEEVVNGELVDLRQESRRLHNMVTQLHQRHHEFTLKVGFMLAWVECSCVCVCLGGRG